MNLKAITDLWDNHTRYGEAGDAIPQQVVADRIIRKPVTLSANATEQI